MSAGYELPEHLFIHGYLKLGGEKMSKTRGNVMDPFPLIERYGADPFRFYCLREVSFGQDGMVSEEGFKARYNSELANELGNLVSRTVSMIGKYRGGAVPAPPPRVATARGAAAPSAGSPLADEADEAAARARVQLDDMDLSGALETIWVFVRRLNRYVEEQAPWKLAKEAASAGVAVAGAGWADGGGAGVVPAPPSGDGGGGANAAAALDATLWDLAEGLRLLSVLLHPFIPQTAAAIRERLGLEPASEAAGPTWEDARWGLLPAGSTVVAGAPLFPRIED
jgi:methionyl-tRNA synthetase